jgi:hypothetical protein
MSNIPENLELEDMISRTNAMKLLGRSRRWFIRREQETDENKRLLAYRLEDRPKAETYYSRSQLTGLFQLKPVQKTA